MNNSFSWNLENNSKIRIQHDIDIVLFLIYAELYMRRCGN